MYSIENKSEESRVIQNNSEKHVPTAQFKDNRSQNETEKGMTAQLEKKENLTGMPDNLKEGIESLSGFSMDDVRVHYNSSKPATVQALAYTQGTDIHVAPGQEKHLPHEAWHVAQQMAGRVSPTTNINGMPVNDNAGLEHEADVMGEKAVQCKSKNAIQLKKITQGVVQRHKWSYYYNKNKEVKNLTYLGPDYEGEPESRPLSSEKIKGHMQRFKKNSGFYVIWVNDGCVRELRKADHDDVMEHLQKSVNIGTEFTFRKKGYTRILDLSTGRPVPEEVANGYSGFIKDFADQMTIVCNGEKKRSKEFGFTVLESSDDENCKIAKVKGMQLDVPQLPKSKHKFKVNISIDNNCIELQTTPISYEIYRLDNEFINKLIFESAEKADLEPATDKKVGSETVYGGGGHISLDSQSAFAGDVNVLHEFIKQYTQTALEQVKKKDGLFSYNDDTNSPLIRNHGLFISLLKKSKGNIESYLSSLIELYKNGTCPKSVNQSELSHYQAVNVDDFLDKPDKMGRIKKGRIEMRNFDAQISIDQLLKQVDALFDILADAYIAKEEQPRTELQPGPSPKPSTSPSPK